MHAIAVGKNLARSSNWEPKRKSVLALGHFQKIKSPQALKRVGPPIKVQKKIFLVDRPGALGYNRI
jgi:hypothetical protein|tara:strand:+ start:325 stop:522 length:198 start_codon:yes stop_codon:yes gene_type:complete